MRAGNRWNLATIFFLVVCPIAGISLALALPFITPKVERLSFDGSRCQILYRLTSVKCGQRIFQRHQITLREGISEDLHAGEFLNCVLLENDTPTCSVIAETPT